MRCRVVVLVVVGIVLLFGPVFGVATFGLWSRSPVVALLPVPESWQRGSAGDGSAARLASLIAGAVVVQLGRSPVAAR